MIVLTAPPPTTTSEFAACLKQLLSGAITVDDSTVSASGAFPAMERVRVDVSGATPVGQGKPAWSSEEYHLLGELTVGALEVIGQPFGSGVQTADLAASAADCRVQVVRTASGQMALRLAGARNGRLVVSATRANVEAALLAQARQAAAAKGVEIKGLQLSWQSDSPKSLSMQVLIQAKKGFLPAANLRVRGQMRIDDALTATVFGLSVDGEGMVGSLGAGLIRPKLQQAEGMSKSLLALPLDAIRITDVRLVADGDTLKVESAFEG